MPAHPVGRWGGIRPDGVPSGGGVYEAACAGCQAALIAYHDDGGAPARPRGAAPALIWTESAAPATATRRRYPCGRGAQAVARAAMATGYSATSRRTEAGAAQRPAQLKGMIDVAPLKKRRAYWQRMDPLEQSIIVKLYQGKEPLTAEEMERIPSAGRAEAAVLRPRYALEIATILDVRKSRVQYVLCRSQIETRRSANRGQAPISRAPGRRQRMIIIKLSRGNEPLTTTEQKCLVASKRGEATVVRPHSDAEIAALLGMPEERVKRFLDLSLRAQEDD